MSAAARRATRDSRARQRWMAILAVAVMVPSLAGAIAGEVVLASYSPAAPSHLTGGKSPPYKPRGWEETRYLEITPAMTLVQGNVLAMEGFAFPEPGSPLCNFGGFGVEGMAKEGRLKGRPTALRVVLDYGGGTEVHLNRVCPGLHILTQAKAVDLFTPQAISLDAWRVAGKTSQPPTMLAFAKGGKVVTHAGKGSVPVDGMDEAWMIAWWGGDCRFDVPLRPAGGSPGRNIWPIYPARSSLLVENGAGGWPMLIVLQRRPAGLTVDEQGWHFRFGGPAGRVIVGPLFGRKWIKARQIAGWKDAVGDEAVQQARAWTPRLRAIPIDVTQSQQWRDGSAWYADRFTFEQVEDDWKTPAQKWAPLPPMLAVAAQMGFPIRIIGAGGEAHEPTAAADWRWLTRLGPLMGLQDRQEIQYSIRAALGPREWLEQPDASTAPAATTDKPVTPGSSPRPAADAEMLRRQLTQEVDKVLMAGHLAPHMWSFGEMSASYYRSTYFHQPYETILTLCWALPHLNATRQENIKAYLRREWAEYSPFQEHWWGRATNRNGALRERHPNDAQAKGWLPGTNFNLQNLYAAAVYSRLVAEPAQRGEIWQQAKAYLKRDLQRSPAEWDYGLPVMFPVKGTRLGTFMTHHCFPSVETRFESANSRLNGYFGYAQLASDVGDGAALGEAMCLLYRALAVRFAQVWFDQYLIDRRVHVPKPLPAGVVTTAPADDAPEWFVRPRTPPIGPRTTSLMRGLYIGPRLAWTYIWKENTPASELGVGARVFHFHVNHSLWSDGEAGGGLAGGRDVIDQSLYYVGLDLTPELGRFYSRYCRSFVALAAREMEAVAPTWYMADGPTYWHSEEVVGPPEVPWAAFLARAFVLGEAFPLLYEYVDQPQARLGDLYYMQKLAVALRSARQPALGEVPRRE